MLMGEGDGLGGEEGVAWRRRAPKQGDDRSARSRGALTASLVMAQGVLVRRCRIKGTQQIQGGF